MSLTKFNKEVQNISLLSDYPNSNDGLTSSELKEKFDQAGKDLKEFINDTLTSELDSIHTNYEETLATKEEIDNDYLKKTDAEATYLTIDDASTTYLTQDDADSDYLKKVDASSTYLTQTDAQNTYDTISNVSSIYATKQALAEAQMGAIVDQSVTREKLSLDVQATLNNADANIDTIISKIPSEATSLNKLADKNWVNGRVQENTANFIGRFDSLEELEEYSGTLTNNDYAYVVTPVVGGNDTITRYRYVASTETWEEEFDMNTTIFTQSQLDTINSGLTASDNAKLINKYNIPSVEIEERTTTTPFNVAEVICANISTTMAENTATGEISGKYTNLLPSLSPKIKITAVDTSSGTGQNIKMTISSTNTANKSNIGIIAGGSNYFDGEHMCDILERTSYNSTNRILFKAYNSTYHIDYDLGTKSSFTYKCYLAFNYGTSKVLKSDDGITYTTASAITGNDEFSYNFTNTRYIRIELKNTQNTNFDFSLYYSYFTNVIGNYVTVDRTNKFTLGNIEQRVDTHYDNIFPTSNWTTIENTKTSQKYSNNNIIIEANGKYVDNDNFYLLNAFNGEHSINDDFSVPRFITTGANTVYMKISFPKKIRIKKFNIELVTQGPFQNMKLQGSNDGTTWNDLYEFTENTSFSTENVISDTNYYLYFRLYKTDNSLTTFQVYEFATTEYETITDIYSQTFTNNQRVLVETPSTVSDIDIINNTLNGTDISAILQPSQKYELIYNEDTNKFTLDGLMNTKVLYDIILSENVTQIDLTGLANKLDENKLYIVGVRLGSIVSGSQQNINLSNFSFTQLGTDKSSGASFFKAYKYTGKTYITGVTYNNRTIYSVALDDNEKISMQSAGTLISAGTRIIIKEVS